MSTEFVVSAPRTLAFREYDEPTLKPHEVRLRTRMSGIKQGTEMALYTGATPFANGEFDLSWRTFVPRDATKPFFPVSLGSWAVAEVIEAGAGVTKFAVGDAVHGSMLHKPTNIKHESELFGLQKGFAPEAALFTDPALFALAVVHDAQIKLGDNVAVIL